MLKFVTTVLLLPTLAALAVLFSLAGSALAKDHKYTDYPLNLTVRNSDSYGYGVAYGNLDKSCSMSLDAGNGHYYQVDSKDWHCQTFVPGTHLLGRLRSIWGRHFIYLAWPIHTNKGNKLREAYYDIVSDNYSGR